MKYAIKDAAKPDFQPLTVEVTMENPDDLRWFYHLMNFQSKEIRAGYSASSKGDFDSRFVPFDTPDKKPLFQAVKAHAAEYNVPLTL